MYDDGKAERGDGKIMAAQTNGEDRQRHAGGAGQYHSEDERHPERHAKLHDEKCGGIGADAVERRVTEIKLAGVAEYEIKADSQHDVDRANDQVRAPIRILNDERQESDDHGDDKEPSSPVNSDPIRQHEKRWSILVRHSLPAFRR